MVDLERWSFHDGTPAKPYKAYGEIWSIGWDIPTCWLIDANNQCWKDAAHGPHLHPCADHELIAEAEAPNDFKTSDRIREALGLGKRETCPHCGQRMP